MHITTLV